MSAPHPCRGTLWPLHTQRPVPSARLKCPGTPQAGGGRVEAQEDPWRVGARWRPAPLAGAPHCPHVCILEGPLTRAGTGSREALWSLELWSRLTLTFLSSVSPRASLSRCYKGVP